MKHTSKFDTPLKTAKGLGSAHHGAGHWMHQRLTAIANIPLVLWLVWSILSLRGASHGEFTEWLAHPINAVLMILMIINMFYHAALGAQVVTEDYVHCGVLKMVKTIGQKFFFIAAGAVCVFSILKIAFAG